MDYAVLRKRMVDEQLIPRGIMDPRVLAAFYKVERHAFIPQEVRSMAYSVFAGADWRKPDNFPAVYGGLDD